MRQFNSWIFTALCPKDPLDHISEISGSALEGLVAQHLIAWIDYSTNKHSLTFWRTQGSLEIDFVIYGRKTFCAIEVKNAKQIYSQDLK